MEWIIDAGAQQGVTASGTASAPAGSAPVPPVGHQVPQSRTPAGWLQHAQVRTPGYMPGPP